MIAQIKRRVFTSVQTIAVLLRNVERVVHELRFVLVARYEHERLVDDVLRSLKLKKEVFV